jgi:hypothetical protein
MSQNEHKLIFLIAKKLKLNGTSRLDKQVLFHNPTRQTSTSRTNNKCLSVLIQQVVVLLISSQINISKRCIFDIYLTSIFI